MEKYKLKDQNTTFWDPTQPKEENKSITGRQVKALDKTPAMLLRLNAGALVVAKEKDIERYEAELEVQNVKTNLKQYSNDGVDFLEIIIKKDSPRKERKYSERYFIQEQKDAENKKFSSLEFYENCLKVISDLHHVVDLVKIAELPKEFYFNLDHDSLNDIEGIIKSTFPNIKVKSSPSIATLIKKSSQSIIPIIQKEYKGCSEQSKALMLFALFKLDHLEINPINQKGKGKKTNDILNDFLGLNGTYQNFNIWVKRLSQLFHSDSKDILKTGKSADKALLEAEIQRLNNILE